MARSRPAMTPHPLPLTAFASIVLVATLAASGPSARAADKVDVGTRPYAIRAHVSFDASARVDGATRGVVLDDWLGLIRRFVGAPWRVDAAAERPAVAVLPIEALVPADLKALGEGVDKAWAVQVRREGATWQLDGREFDALTSRLGELHRVEVRDPVDLPRGLLDLALALFEPLADVGEQKAGGVTFTVRGGAIDPAQPIGVVAPVGSTFRVLRLFLDKDDRITSVQEIPYSYFVVDERFGAFARCSIIKGIGDPLTNRFGRKNRLVALGIQPAQATTRLRFVLKGDRTPAAGYRLTARSTTPESKVYDVGVTDRQGRVELPPRFAPGLAYVRLLAGSSEPMADVPVMPGETRTERMITIEGRPRTLDLEARLDALRDSIVDTVAQRSRLEARMKARVEGGDLDGFDASLGEFRKLRTRDDFAADLARLKTDAEAAEASSKTLILTRNARNQLDETDALITRYLDDEPIRALIDTAASVRAEKAQAKPAPAKPR